MNFKLVYVFGFFFIDVKSMSLFPDSDTYWNLGLNSPEKNNQETSEAPKESPLAKLLKLRDKAQPATEQLSNLKDKLPKWKNPFAKTEEEPDFGLANLYGEESEDPEKKPMFGGFNAGETYDKVKDKLKNIKWPLGGHKDEHSENPETPSKFDDEPDYGLPNFFGEGEESPEKKPLFGGFNPKESYESWKDKFKNAKWPLGGGHEDHNQGSPETHSKLDDEPDYGLPNFFGENEENPEKKTPSLGGFNPGETYDKVKDKLKNIKWPLGGHKDQHSENPETPSEHDEEPKYDDEPDDYGLSNFFGDDEKPPEKIPLFDGFNPAEKYGQLKDKFKNIKWPLGGNKDHNSESPETPLEDFIEEESPQKKSLFDGFNPGEQFDKAKNTLQNLKWPLGHHKKDSESPDDNEADHEAQEHAKPHSFFDNLKPGEKFDKAKDAIKNIKWPNLFGRKNHDPNSPEGDEFPLAELADDLKKLEEKIPDEHYPIHGLNPHHEGNENKPDDSPDSQYYSAENPDDTSGNKSHTPETMGEMLEEELEELEKMAHGPEKPDHQWPDWSWNDHDDQEPESHKPHSKENGHGDTNHHGHSPEHGKKDESGEHHLPKSHSKKSEGEERGSPEHHKESHQPKKHHADENGDISDIPSWFWAPAAKDSKSKEHKDHHQPHKHDPESEKLTSEENAQLDKVMDILAEKKLHDMKNWSRLNPNEKEGETEPHSEFYQEINYDVRDIGNNLEKVKLHGDDSDGDGTEDEDDDDGSDDDDENKDGNETDDNDEDDDNDIGREKEKEKEKIDSDEEKILKELEERNKDKKKPTKKPKRDSSDEADDDSSDSEDEDEDDDDDDDDGASDDKYFDDAKKNFSLWSLVLPMIKDQLPSVPNPFSVLNRVTVSFGSINDLQRDPEYLQKSLIKKVNQKYNEKHEKVLPGTTISFWPPTISHG